VVDLAGILPELPRLAAECYAGPWQYEYEDCRATLTPLGDITVVAIPGTHGAHDIGDLIADGLLMATWYSGAIGWGPEGSLRRAHGLFGLLSPVLTGPVVLAAHSLGGAFGTVVASLLAQSGQPPLWLETYGAPHSAGALMVAILADVPGIEYENAGDPIPHATLGRWRPWRAPRLLGSHDAEVAIERHYLNAYRELLVSTVAA
jgi:hypothetical protein